MSEKIRNPFEHHHPHDDHGHGHDHDHDHVAVEELDPAQQSLADALRVSFFVLKIAMVILLVFYLFSGFFSVPSGMVAVRLRFGKMVGDDKSRIIPPGSLHPAFPYPIEEVLLISTQPKQIEINNAFWFESNNPQGQTIDEMAQGRTGPLNPEKDGSLLTGDANIVHGRWTLTYSVPESGAGLYAENVGDDRVAEQLVRAAAEEGIVLAVSQRTSDDLIRGQFDSETASRHIQSVLDRMRTGIKVEPRAFTLARAIMPLSVRAAYEAVTTAESEKARQIEEAQQARARILGETAGEGSRAVMELINRYEDATNLKNDPAAGAIDSRLDWVFMNLKAPKWLGTAKLAPEDSARLWELFTKAEGEAVSGDAESKKAALAAYTAELDRLKLPADARATARISGRVAEVINDAASYRAIALGEVRREATIFKSWYETYRGNPELRRVVENKLWQEAKAQILAGDVDTFYLPPGETVLWLNRDPRVQREREERRMRETDEQRRLERERAQRAAAANPPPSPPSSPPRPPGPPPGGDQH